MPDFLLELFSEEIPARMQARAAEDLRRLITNALVGAGLPYEGAKSFVTPRRLTLAVKGVPVRQPDVKEEKKGPRVGAPEGAIQGFLRSTGLSSIHEAKVAADKKGDFYLALIEKPGRPAIDVIAEIVPEVVKTFPWPKAMRWGPPSRQPGSLAWVRPLHSVVATFGPETEEPEIVPFAIDGIKAGDETRGPFFSSFTSGCRTGTPLTASASRRGVTKALAPSWRSPASTSASVMSLRKSSAARACMRAGISSENSSSRKSGIVSR